MPRRGTIAAITGSNAGSAIVATTNAVHRSAACSGSSQPGQQRENAGGRGQGATQVVQHLPLTDQRQKSIAALRRIVATEQPGQQLPVAARPAMIARCGDVVARRKFFDDFDIGDESGACECSFEQIVTEQRPLRYAIRQRRLERIDVVDALAGIRAFAEQILIDVGDGGVVRIDARHAGEDALEDRAFATDRQRRCHSRLQYGVAFDDATGARRRSEDG